MRSTATNWGEKSWLKLNIFEVLDDFNEFTCHGSDKLSLWYDQFGKGTKPCWIHVFLLNTYLLMSHSLYSPFNRLIHRFVFHVPYRKIRPSNKCLNFKCILSISIDSTNEWMNRSTQRPEQPATRYKLMVIIYSIIGNSHKLHQITNISISCSTNSIRNQFMDFKKRWNMISVTNLTVF